MIARIVIIVAWLFIALVFMGLALTGILPYTSWWGIALGVFFIGSTWFLCWVGFPIGWRLTAGLRDAFDEGTVPWLICIVISLFVSLVTFALSLPIAIGQIIFKRDW